MKILNEFPLMYQTHCDKRHEKTNLKVFVFVIPKEGWARVTDFSEFDSADIIGYILKKSLSYQKKDGRILLLV